MSGNTVTYAKCTYAPNSSAPTTTKRCQTWPPGVSTDPHIITAAARTGTDIELRNHTSVAPFDVAVEEWFPAAAEFAVTVDAASLHTLMHAWAGPPAPHVPGECWDLKVHPGVGAPRDD